VPWCRYGARIPAPLVAVTTRCRRSPRVTNCTTDRRVLEGVLIRVFSVTASSPTTAFG